MLSCGLVVPLKLKPIKGSAELRVSIVLNRAQKVAPVAPYGTLRHPTTLLLMPALRNLTLLAEKICIDLAGPQLLHIEPRSREYESEGARSQQPLDEISLLLAKGEVLRVVV